MINTVQRYDFQFRPDQDPGTEVNFEKVSQKSYDDLMDEESENGLPKWL